jgi:hypothetical protein
MVESTPDQFFVVILVFLFYFLYGCFWLILPGLGPTLYLRGAGLGFTLTIDGRFDLLT